MSDRTDALREFLRLGARDQSAVAKHLSPEEREHLLVLKRERRKSARHAPSAKVASPDRSVFSPWLAKHLARVVTDAEAGHSKLTPAAQAALHNCLLRSRPTS
jgi:hypothetical protein